MAVQAATPSAFSSSLSRPSTTRILSTTEQHQSSVRPQQIPEFVPRTHVQQPPTRHRQCSHMSNTDSQNTVCALDQLLQQDEATTPPLKDEQSESLSSTGSSSSLKTHSAMSNGGYYGQGHGWIQPSLWGPPAPFRATKKAPSAKSVPRVEDEADRYHLLSMADGIVDEQIHSDVDPMFNPSLAGLSLDSSPLRSPLQPRGRRDRPTLDPAQFSPDQIASLVASFAPSPQQSPVVAQLVARATRLAKGLAHPPPNRGFRPKANELPDQDESNTTVFVGGLSQGVTESILHDIFAPFGSIAYVKVPPGKGCGFVQFYLKQDSEYAIKQMQGFECMGCSLRTHWGRSQSDRSTPTTPAPEHVANQVTSVCAALGVPKEHTELVLRVLNACSGSGTDVITTP